MDYVQTLRTVADSIFDLVDLPNRAGRWLALSVRPWRAHAKVSAAWRSEPSKRYEGDLTPIMFWLVAVALPYTLVTQPLFAMASSVSEVAASIGSLPWLVRFTVIAFASSAWPLGAAYSLCRRAESRDVGALRRLFEIQCVLLAPAHLALLVIVSLAVTFQADARTVNGALVYVFSAFVLYTQITVAICEGRGNWLVTFETAIVALLGAMVHAFAIMLLVGGLLAVSFAEIERIQL